LHGLRQHVQIFDVDEFAFEGQRIVLPAPLDHIDIFAKARPRLRDIDIHAIEFERLITGADAKREPAARQDINRRSFLRHLGWAAPRENDDGGSDACVLGALRHIVQYQEDSRDKSMSGKMVLSDPDFINAERIAELDFCHNGLDALLGRHILMPADDFELAELYGSLLSSKYKFFNEEHNGQSAARTITICLELMSVDP
jgi:hypothetical protein